MFGIGSRRRAPLERWLVRLYDAPSGRADYVFAAARSEREALDFVHEFLAYADRGWARADRVGERLGGPPQWGDLGATPLGRGGQRVAEIRRWHDGGDDFGPRELDGHRWPEEDDLQLIHEWRVARGFQP